MQLKQDDNSSHYCKIIRLPIDSFLSRIGLPCQIHRDNSTENLACLRHMVLKVIYIQYLPAINHNLK